MNITTKFGSAKRIIETYSQLAVQLNMTIMIESEANRNSFIFVGNTDLNLISNSPKPDSIIFVNGGNASNIFTISGQQGSIISNVRIFIRDTPNAINTLDLRPIQEQVKRHYNRNVILLSRKVQNNLKFDLILEGTSRILMTIRLTGFLKRCEMLHIILHNAPMTLKCDKLFDHFTPVPLEFNATELIVIAQHDIEPHTEIFVHQKFGDFRYVHLDDGLIVTNKIQFANAATYLENPCTVLFRHYFSERDFFRTFLLKFDDQIITLNDHKNEIRNATMFEDWFEKF